jgi:hypothetical protein
MAVNALRVEGPVPETLSSGRFVFGQLHCRHGFQAGERLCRANESASVGDGQ